MSTKTDSDSFESKVTYVTMGPGTDYWAPMKEDYEEYILDYGRGLFLLELTYQDLVEIRSVALIDTIFRRAQQNNVIRIISEGQAMRIKEHGLPAYILSHRPGAVKRLFLSRIATLATGAQQLDVLEALETEGDARPRVLQAIEHSRKTLQRLAVAQEGEALVPGIHQEILDLTEDDEF